MANQTALLEEHIALGGKIVDFAGWSLPIQYTGLLDEHTACRTHAGLFDVSHMGEFLIEGDDAGAFLDYLVTNQPSQIEIGHAQYTVMCTDTAGIVDDLIIYRLGKNKFLAVVNAANTPKDFDWFQQVHRRGQFRCHLENASSAYSQIAVQGPRATEIVQKLTSTPLASVRPITFVEGKMLDKIPTIFARTGYTGEDGFELYVPWSAGPEVWRALLEAGRPLGLKPCGLGARDTLRLEMKYPLYGNELSNETNPLEAGLGWVVKFGKPDFVGKSALLQVKSNGLKRKLVGFKLIDRGVPRPGYTLFAAGGSQPIGRVTSGTHSPSLGIPIGIAYVDLAHSANGSTIEVDIRGNRVKAEVIPTPFYTPAHKKGTNT